MGNMSPHVNRRGRAANPHGLDAPSQLRKQVQPKNHRLLEQSLRILEAVAASTETPLTFKEICEKIPLPKSTVYHLAQTLASLNYLSRDEESGRYSIGLKSFEIGNAYLSANPFYQKAKEIIEAVSVRCNETTHFAILNGTDVVYLFKFDSTQPIRIFSHVGKRMPAHTTAIGKALLSGFDDKTISELYPGGALPTLTPSTITSLEVLLRQIEEVRKTHLAYEKEESTPHVQCYAVPIMNKQGHAVAGVSISIPVFRKKSAIKPIVPLLFEAKEQLETILRMYE